MTVMMAKLFITWRVISELKRFKAALSLPDLQPPEAISAVGGARHHKLTTYIVAETLRNLSRKIVAPAGRIPGRIPGRILESRLFSLRILENPTAFSSDTCQVLIEFIVTR
jgi:hypothetical protein